MSITEQKIDQAYSDLKASCGGVRNDYFGLLYLEQEFGIDRPKSFSKIAFGGNDYGIDGFHFDRQTRNLYLFQFKWTESHSQFKSSLQRLIDAGVARVFASENQDSLQNQLLQQIKSCLLENEAIIEKVYFHFIFTGDPGEAERSQVLEKLREDLENKKYLIDKRFGRPVTMVLEYRSARTSKVGPISHVRKTNTYPITLEGSLSSKGPNDELMTVGFARLIDLYKIFKEMGPRFLERNIRSVLSDEEAVNRSILTSLRRAILDESDEPEVFAFNHNGVTMFAEAISIEDGAARVTEPRLLNGAQTVATLARFLRTNGDHPSLESNAERLRRLKVLCKIVTEATPDFVTMVTINNNRQNPVEPWNLRANDLIQLQLQDKFRDDVGIYYERQENAFQNLSDEELEGLGVTEHKQIELRRLAQTFLVSDGEIDKLLRFRQVFEEDRIYDAVFNERRLSADTRRVVLCYKAQFRLRRLSQAIVEKGANKYAYVQRARYLLWALLSQGILNDAAIESRAEEFGGGLSLEAQYTEWLAQLATTRCRFILGELVGQKPYMERAEEGNYSFLRTNAAYKRCMEIAYRKWRWVEKRLR